MTGSLQRSSVVVESCGVGMAYGGKMATVFPKAVMYDPTKEHHVSVYVNRVSGTILYSCGECDVEHFLPLEDLEMLKRFIRRGDDTQILIWIERDA